jgi:hypothetical protein
MADEKDISEHGKLTAAGRLLTRHLIQVGQEKTESNGFDDKGSSRQITKIEALARLMWKLAFGYEEEVRKLTKDGKLALVKKIIAPDKTLIALIYDRLEGKVNASEEEGGKKPPLSSRIKDQARRRVNRLASNEEESS